MDIDYKTIHNYSIRNYSNNPYIDEDGVCWNSSDIEYLLSFYVSKIFKEKLSLIKDKYNVIDSDVESKTLDTKVTIVTLDYHRKIYRMYIQFTINVSILSDSGNEINEVFHHCKIVKYILVNNSNYFEVIEEYIREDKFDIREEINEETIHV